MKSFMKWILVLGAGLGVTALQAHHSFSATYDESKEEIIEGTVVQFLMRNPHSMLHVEVKTDDGDARRYAIEWAGVAGLGADGITRTTLRIGDTVIVKGNPGRNAADHRLRLLSIDRPIDGWHWGGAFL